MSFMTTPGNGIAPTGMRIGSLPPMASCSAGLQASTIFRLPRRSESSTGNGPRSRPDFGCSYSDVTTETRAKHVTRTSRETESLIETNMKTKNRIELTPSVGRRRSLTTRRAVASLAPMTKQILLTRRSPAYWRVTFNHPPLNIFAPEAIPQLNQIITPLETDEQVKGVAFHSARPRFSLTHYDFLAKLEDTTSL